MRRFLSSAVLPALLAACSGETTTLGLDEPLRVEGAQFFEGDLPGTPAPSREEIEQGAELVSPTVTAAGLPLALAAGRPSVPVEGRISDDGAAIGLRFEEFGGGYWVIPAGNPELTTEGELTWDALVDIAPSAPTGVTNVAFVAIDPSGEAGSQRTIEVCVTPEIPDNLNACNPTIAPPELVLSLAWDTPVDLDLRVVTPEGKVVDPKHPTTTKAGPDGKVVVTPEAGVLQADANSNCSGSGRHRENLVWNQAKPAPGTYFVYVTLFDTCGESSVRYEVSLHSRAPGENEGEFTVREDYRIGGSLIAAQESSAARLGTFVTEFVVR